MGKYAIAVVFSVVFSFVFALSCSRESAIIDNKNEVKESVREVIAESEGGLVTLQPNNPSKGATVSAIVKGFRGNLLYQWFVNGTLNKSSAEDFFDTKELKKGDSLKVVVISEERKISSNEIYIVNSPPVIKKAYLFPKNPNGLSDFKVEVEGSDIDNDTITYTYEWFINGEKVEGVDSQTFRNNGLKRGDELMVNIVPFDGTDRGSPVTRSVRIKNSPPIFLEEPINYTLKGTLLSAKVKASDPDGDPLTYSLKKAPAGMVIDKTTGLITWKVTEKDAGRHPVTVQVTDGHGGEALYNFDVTIGFEGR